MKLFLILITIFIPFSSFLQKTGTLVLSGDADYYGYDKSEFIVHYNQEVLGRFDKYGHFDYSAEQKGPFIIKHPDFVSLTLDDISFSKKHPSHTIFEKINPEAKERILESFKTEQRNTCIGSNKRELSKSALMDTVARLPGRDAELRKFLDENITYPQRALEQGIEGKVYLSFIVEADGSITCIEILKGVEYILDREAFNCVKKLPRFIPAMREGLAVPSVFIFPVHFHFN